MSDIYNTINDTVNPLLSILDNEYVRPVLILLLVLYGGLAKPLMPNKFWIIDNIYFRAVGLSLIAWVATHDPFVAVAAAVFLIGVTNTLQGKSLFETFQGPATAIYPGCMNITVFDLLESFNNDKEALLNAMVVSRVPGDIKVTDYYSPLIATYLLNHGFNLKSPCKPPGATQNSTVDWVGASAQ